VHKGKDSDRQPGPALGTTGIDNATSILGGHPGAKTMGTVTLQFAGLKSSFHGSLLLNVFSNKITPWQARKGRKEYSFPRCGVKIIKDSMAWHQGVDNFFRQV
jgi:hypothetical protein